MSARPTLSRAAPTARRALSLRSHGRHPQTAQPGAREGPTEWDRDDESDGRLRQTSTRANKNVPRSGLWQVPNLKDC
jgi:hypothetical protein